MCDAILPHSLCPMFSGFRKREFQPSSHRRLRQLQRLVPGLRALLPALEQLPGLVQSLLVLEPALPVSFLP